MKAINYLNYFFVSIPILLVLIAAVMPNIGAELACCGLLSTILTGLFQLIFGIKMLIDEPEDKDLQHYISGVIFFFLLWFVNGVILHYEFIYYILFVTPVILAIYFSTITYKKAKQ